MLERALPLSGNSLRIGVTGIPGVGKSTLIDVLGLEFIRAGHRVAVLAVDPSSMRSGGSILGDKTRMEKLAADPQAFIRPSPSGGLPGGVARATRESIILCEAAGFDRVLIETVGVGQGEMAVDRLVDLTVLMMIAGAGDELQGIKRGIMEVTDAIVIAKADGDNRGRSDQALLDMRNAIGLLPPLDNGRRAEVMRCSAIEQEGIIDLQRTIENIAAMDQRAGIFQQRRKQQDLQQLHAAIGSALMERFRQDPAVAAALPELEQAVMQGRMSPFRAATELMARFRTAS